MSDEAARQEAERRDFEWEVFVAADGINSIRQSGMTHEDAFVAGAAWQAAQPVVVTAEQRQAMADRMDEHMESKYGFVLGTEDRDVYIDAAVAGLGIEVQP